MTSKPTQGPGELVRRVEAGLIAISSSADTLTDLTKGLQAISHGALPGFPGGLHAIQNTVESLSAQLKHDELTKPFASRDLNNGGNLASPKENGRPSIPYQQQQQQQAPQKRNPVDIVPLRVDPSKYPTPLKVQPPPPPKEPIQLSGYLGDLQGLTVTPTPPKPDVPAVTQLNGTSLRTASPEPDKDRGPQMLKVIQPKAPDALMDMMANELWPKKTDATMNDSSGGTGNVSPIDVNAWRNTPMQNESPEKPREVVADKVPAPKKKSKVQQKIMEAQLLLAKLMEENDASSDGDTAEIDALETRATKHSEPARKAPAAAAATRERERIDSPPPLHSRLTMDVAVPQPLRSPSPPPLRASQTRGSVVGNNAGNTRSKFEGPSIASTPTPSEMDFETPPTPYGKGNHTVPQLDADLPLRFSPLLKVIQQCDIKDQAPCRAHPRDLIERKLKEMYPDVLVDFNYPKFQDYTHAARKSGLIKLGYSSPSDGWIMALPLAYGDKRVFAPAN